KSEFVEVTAETGDHVEPPPPEAVEPDPQMSPEEIEQARKDYLLTRFWISARGYWGKNGDRLAWLFSIGLLLMIIGHVGFQYGIHVWPPEGCEEGGVVFSRSYSAVIVREGGRSSVQGSKPRWSRA